MKQFSEMVQNVHRLIDDTVETFPESQAASILADAMFAMAKRGVECIMVQAADVSRPQ